MSTFEKISYDSGIAYILICIFLLTIAGCICGGEGEILVGQPQVFSRQRLVNRRLTEQQWLEKQLEGKTPTEQSLQGYQDIRTFEGIYNKTDVSLDPLGGKLVVAQSNLNFQNVQNQLETNALQHQIDILKLQQQLTALRNSPAASGNTGSSDSPGSGSSGSTQKGSSESASDSSSTVFSNPPALPNAKDIETTKAKVTSIELLRDQLAWRNAVQAALREQELDDSHDLNGLTLYTLKFDLSVLPGGKNNDRYGRVEFDLAPSQSSRPDKDKSGNTPISYEQYVEWIYHLNQAAQAEVVALQKRMEHGQLSQEEKVSIAFFAEDLSRRLRIDKSSRVAIDKRLSRLSALGKALAMIEAIRVVKLTGDPLDEVKLGIFEVIRDKYQSALMTVVDIKDEPLPVTVDGRNYYVLQASPLAYGIGDKRLNERLSGLNPYVFVVDPKEEAQNISDVAATEKLRNLALSLKAVIPQSGLTAGNYTEYISRSQELLQGILRRPLVVAYSDSDHGKKFGWILGPRFEIGKSGKPRFSHTTVQHSVQASLAVPGWLKNLDIPYVASWVGGIIVNQGIVHVVLPGNPAAITTFLFAHYNGPRGPFIEPPTNSDIKGPIIYLKAKQPGDILIRGHDLWRNPKVFVGAQSADQVAVLPDMNGLSAHFNSVAMPPGPSNSENVVDLSVVTSEGIATLSGAVKILPDTGK